jgi:hypothetical protein
MRRPPYHPARVSYPLGPVAGAATPSEVGARAEREVATALARAGHAVFVPFFALHSRIDLVVIDERGEAPR